MGKKKKDQKDVIEVEPTDVVEPKVEVVEEVKDVEEVKEPEVKLSKKDLKAVKKAEKQAEENAAIEAKKAEKQAKIAAKQASKDSKVEKASQKLMESSMAEAKKLIENTGRRTNWMNKYFNNVSGKESLVYDYIVKDDHKRLLERANTLIGNKEKNLAQPVIILVPDSFDNRVNVRYRYDEKSDKSYVLHYDQAYVTILFFGTKRLYTYRANIDYRNGSIGFDKANDFNYFDIANVETVLSYDNTKNPQYHRLDLELYLTNGNSVSIHLRNHRLHSTYNLPTLLTPAEEKVIDLLKSKIYSKN